MTLRLWLKLRNPPQDNPLFRRVQTIHQDQIPWFIWLLAIIVIPFLLIPALIFTATSYSIYWAISVSQVLQGLRDKDQYDLLATLPVGNFGVTWLACQGAVHRNNSFRRLDGYGLWFVRIGMGFLIVNGLYNAVIDPFGIGSTKLEIIIYIVFAIALFLDHYSSVVLGCLVAMLIPAVKQDRFSSSIASPGVLLILQVMSYIMMTILAFGWFKGIDLGNPDVFVLTVQHAVVILILFAFSREITVWVCWRLLIMRHGITIKEAWAVLDW